ncbi:MAG: transcriptional repressor [Phycisphaerales bacterium]|nr:transcriptional repressor [Phycisphaerales bacterium]
MNPGLQTSGLDSIMQGHPQPGSRDLTQLNAQGSGSAPNDGADPAELAAMAPLCAVFRRFLKAQDLKYTPERADILNAIIERDGVFEVEELMLEMRKRGYQVSKATAYRTIKLLEDAGIINQALFDSKQAHYQLIYGKAPRDHIVCMKTGKLVEFTNDELIALRDRICREHGWEPVGHRFQIYAISPEGRQLIDRMPVDDDEG